MTQLGDGATQEVAFFGVTPVDQQGRLTLRLFHMLNPEQVAPMYPQSLTVEQAMELVNRVKHRLVEYQLAATLALGEPEPAIKHDMTTRMMFDTLDIIRKLLDEKHMATFIKDTWTEQGAVYLEALDLYAKTIETMYRTFSHTIE